jgi:hypothetical protein
MGGTKSAPALPRLWRQIGLGGIAIGILDGCFLGLDGCLDHLWYLCIFMLDQSSRWEPEILISPSVIFRLPESPRVGPEDLDEAELLKFFSKQGANTAIVAHARTSSFASITFPGTPEVARFLSRVAHAYADEKGTLIARLMPKKLDMEQMPTLPALPAPNLSTSTMVRWWTFLRSRVL